jgi:hypothetical protein
MNEAAYYGGSEVPTVFSEPGSSAASYLAHDSNSSNSKGNVWTSFGFASAARGLSAAGSDSDVR